MDVSIEKRRYRVIMIGKPPEEDIYTQELVQGLTSLGVIVYPLYVSGILNIIRKLPKVLRLFLTKDKNLLHFQFHISVLTYRRINYLLVPIISLFYLPCLLFGGRIITTLHTVYPLSLFKLKLSKHGACQII